MQCCLLEIVTDVYKYIYMHHLFQFSKLIGIGIEVTGIFLFIISATI